MRPKILYVTPHWPHAPRYGAQERTLNICRLLRRVGDVSLVIASPDDPDSETLRKTQSEFDVLAIMRLEPHAIAALERLRCEFDPTFTNTHYRVVAPSAREAILRALAEHDVAWVHGLHEANAFGIYRWPHTVLDVDDVQSRVYAARARADSNLFRRLLDYRMSLIWRRRERRLNERFDAVAVCSDDDRRYLENGMPIQVVPNGFASPRTPPRRAPAVPPRFGFIGLCDYGPNRDGVEWFIGKVWPLVKRVVPGTRLRLVGRGTEVWASGVGHDIDALGYVDDPADEIATWTAMIVPIRFGGGTRIKIAEAFSRRCPVVSTSVGASGYEADGESILIGDEPQDFAVACARLLEDPDLADRLATNGWQQFISKCTWDAIGQAVVETVRMCAARTAPWERADCRADRASSLGGRLA